MMVLLRKLPAAGALGLCFGLATAASAAEPQDNRCWGEVASQLAQAESADGLTGGGMGLHSRSETAANINGGFANSANPFGQNQPRAGVGNVSAGPPHNTHPSDGGNGQHAANNGEGFTQLVNAVTGDPVAADGSNLETFECSTLDQEVLP
jgi:hypothetical protein